MSVIIPCYNAEKTIKFAIQSVLMQTYSNIEIIVINDGSNDKSSDIVLQLKESNKYIITLFNQANLGVSSARNKGIDNASGKYIFFLDADDIIAPDTIALLVDGLEQNDCDVAYCKYTRKKYDWIGNCVYQLETQKTLLEKQLNKRKFKLGFFTYLYIKEKICNNRIIFPIDLKYGEDRVFAVNYLLCCKRGVYLDKALYYYTKNPMSVMNNVNWQMTDSLKATRIIEHLLIDNKVMMAYSDYLYPRSVWALTKNFSVGGQWELLQRADSEYQIARQMKKLLYLRQAEIPVRITAALYIINKKLFFQLIKDASQMHENIHRNRQVRNQKRFYKIDC